MAGTRRRTAAARSALALLLVAVGFGLVVSTGASSEAQPDIADAAGDQLLFGVEPACLEGVCVTGGGIDLIAVWIGNETATHLEVHLRTSSGDHASGAPGTPAALGADTFTVGFTVGGTAYNGTARVGASGVEAVGSPVTQATASGSLLSLVLSRAALGDPAAGTVMSGVQALASRDDPSFPLTLVTDQAPDAGAAPVAYAFTMDSSPGVPGANGTSSATASSQDSTTSPGSPTPAPTGGPSGSPTAPSTTRAPGSGGDSSSANDSFMSDPGYLAMSAVGFIAVLAVSILGLVRWSN